MNVKPEYLRKLAAEFERDAANELRMARAQSNLAERKRWFRHAKRDNLTRVALLRYANDLEKGKA